MVNSHARLQSIRSLICNAGLLLALSLSFSCQSKLKKTGANVLSSQESTDSQTANLIASVKDLSASRLEKGLPPARFEDWVRANAGPDWTITWSFTQGPKNASNHALDFPDSVDVRGDTKNGRYFRLSIGTTTTGNQVLLFWLSGAVNVRHNWIGVEHLSQFPRVLNHPSQGSRASEGLK